GGRGEQGSVYVHVEPGASFIAGGFWRPEAELMRRWRDRLMADPAGFLEITEQMADAGHPVGVEESYKRMPRGTERFAETEIEPWLKARSLIAERAVTDDELKHPSFTETLVAT